MPKFEFRESNSGGFYRLSKQDYESLFRDGWKYEATEWDIKDGYDKHPLFGGDDDVPYGWRFCVSLEAENMQTAVERWEDVTGRNFFEEGCNCCGAPFEVTDEDGESMSGDTVVRRVVRPWPLDEEEEE